MPTERIVLGIDPGLATIGYGLLREGLADWEIVDFGVLETPAGLDLAERLVLIQEDLRLLIERFHPTESYVEELFFAANTKTAMQVAQARGVIIASLSSYGLRPRSLTPLQVKVGVTGDGRADKRQVQYMLRRHFSLRSLPRPDDAADALAIAWCGACLL